jgi:hypothetical protein
MWRPARTSEAYITSHKPVNVHRDGSPAAKETGNRCMEIAVVILKSYSQRVLSSVFEDSAGSYT